MAEKSALMRALLEGVLYDLMVRSNIYNVIVADGVTLADKLQEIVNALNGRVKVSDIVNDLTTGGDEVPLSAEQGKILKDLYDSISIPGFTETDPTVPDWAKAATKPSYTAEEIRMQSTDGSPLLIDIIQSIVNALNEKYSATNQPPYPVASVNGKGGTVQLVASDVGADPAGSAESRVSEHNTDTDAHNDIRLELQAINTRLTAFFDSDDQTLDELSEIVAYITSNKTLIEAITTSKVSATDIVNNLTTNVANKPLSAAQGVVLKGLIDTVSGSLSNYQPKGDYALRSEIPAVPTKVSAFTNDAGYLTEHQDISGKLDANKLPEAINTALAQAKESGEFDGEAGPQGPQGETGLTWKGEWNADSKYYFGDAVYYNGSAYFHCKKGDVIAPEGIEPGTDDTVWSLLASKGDKGEQGIQGEKGEKGDKGDSGVYVGNEEPTDETVQIWIDLDGDPVTIDNIVQQTIAALPVYAGEVV